MDVFEYPERIRITMGLPGVEPDSIRVNRIERGLRVTARRSLELAYEARVRRLEIPRGLFQRDIELPPGEFSVQLCSLANGCPNITLQWRDSISDWHKRQANFGTADLAWGCAARGADPRRLAVPGRRAASYDRPG
jgi:hypothetical protein